MGTITERSVYTTELIELLKKIPPESVATYEMMESKIGLDVRPGNDGYGYQKSARDILEKEHGIVFETITKVGLKKLTSEEIGLGSGNLYLKRKKSLIRKSKIRISTINDKFENLSKEAQLQVNAHRTILAFDAEMTKPKNLLKVTEGVIKKNELIGFEATINLFKK